MARRFLGTLPAIAQYDAAYDAARRALCALLEAQSLREAKEIRDQAEAIRAYARQAKNRELEILAAEVRLRAEVRLGEMLRAQKATVGLNKGTIRRGSEMAPRDDRPTLAEGGIDKKLSSRSQKLAAIPAQVIEDYLGKCKASNRAPTAEDLIEARRRADSERARRAAADLPRHTSVCRLEHCDLRRLNISKGSVDCIVTDPPYGQEFLPLYSILAESAVKWLKPGGTLAVMSGQQYLPEVIGRLCIQGLEFRWQMAFMTPRGTVRIFPRRVTSAWKPVWLLTRAGAKPRAWINDVVHSERDDKDFHPWGQSVSGMSQLVERLTKPGDLIVDPFLGGGTTAIAAVRARRRFIGCDIENACVEMTLARLAELSTVGVAA
jgi:site-specific DNA-methyltransferase (adenine-specific)